MTALHWPHSSRTSDFEIATVLATWPGAAAWHYDSVLGLFGPVSVYCDLV